NQCASFLSVRANLMLVCHWNPVCHSERSEESSRPHLGPSRFLAALGMTEKPAWYTKLKCALMIGVVLLSGCSKPAARVVVYSAQDQEFATAIFDEFTKRTGLAVAPKYDTEATKSVGLATELSMEAKRPRCDVHWNNEILGTIRLAKEGVYEAYQSPSAESYSAWAKPSDRTWTAFAARARIIVVNTNKVPESERPKSLFDLADPKWKGR